MLHLPGGDVVAPEWARLDKTLKEGDGIAWSGDPRLYLQIGILVHKPTGKQGRRLEVWRSNEDGSQSMVGHWHPSEQHRIAFDLANMRLERPGRQDVLDRIDKANEKLQRDAAEKQAEAMYETLDHAIHLHVAREHGEHQHFIPDPLAHLPKKGEPAPAALEATPAPSTASTDAST